MAVCSPPGAAITIHRFGGRAFTIDELTASGSLPAPVVDETAAVLSTVTEKSVILDRTSTTTCRGCMGGHRRQEPVWPSVRGAGVKAVSPAERGRSEATRLDAGEPTLTLLA